MDLRPPKVMKSASVQQPLFGDPLPFPLSSRPADLPRQVKGGMNMGKRCLQSRPRGPAPKISPVRKSLSENQVYEFSPVGTAELSPGR